MLVRRENDWIHERIIINDVGMPVAWVLERAAVVGVGQGQALDPREGDRPGELAKVGVVVHFDVERVLETLRRERREHIVAEIPAVAFIHQWNSLRQNITRRLGLYLHVLDVAQRQETILMQRFDAVVRQISAEIHNQSGALLK